VIAILHFRDPSFFVNHRPLAFTAFAAPHVGIMKYRGRFWQWVAVKWGHRLLGRTGDQLYTWDTFSASDERPLLEVMSDPGMWLSVYKLYVWANRLGHEYRRNFHPGT
jgi:hypothetical protein